jgi:hypothetical protein
MPQGALAGDQVVAAALVDMTGKEFTGVISMAGIGQLGILRGVLDLAFLSSVLNAYQVCYDSPNFRAAISCISSRERVPYMSMVVW